MVIQEVKSYVYKIKDIRTMKTKDVHLKNPKIALEAVSLGL